MTPTPALVCPPPSRRRGVILIVTIVIVFAIAALALSLGYSMRAEAGIAANAAAGRQAQLAERAAEQYVLAALAATTDDDTGQPLNSLDQGYWSNVPVGGGAGGRFWIVRPDYNDPNLPPFGLVEESAKIDLNTVDFPRLMKLPGMTEPLAASIIDWRDADDDPTEGVGSESQQYQGKSPAYRCKNAPFETVDELLLVDGMTPELLYGPGDQPPLGLADSASGGGLFNNEQWQRRGFFDLFTVWSDVVKKAPDGSDRVDVNADDLGPLRDKIDQLLGGGKGDSLQRKQGNVFLLAKNLGVEEDDLRKIEPYLISTSNGSPVENKRVRGKINVNAAPREVLLTADEDASEDLADNIIDKRRSQTRQYPGTMAWMLSAVPDAIEQFDDDVTAAGQFYSADVVATNAAGRAFRRVRIVVDAGDRLNPQIVYRRDLSDRGWPLDPQILADLRAGESGGG